MEYGHLFTIRIAVVPDDQDNRFQYVNVII